MIGQDAKATFAWECAADKVANVKSAALARFRAVA
jgi:hypothetical protein